MDNIAPQFCQLAVMAARALPASERADVYEYAACILNETSHPEEASAALEAAKDLRNAEAAQARFDKLLSAALNQNKVQ